MASRLPQGPPQNPTAADVILRPEGARWLPGISIPGDRDFRPPSGRLICCDLVTRDLKSLATIARPPGENRSECGHLIEYMQEQRPGMQVDAAVESGLNGRRLADCLRNFFPYSVLRSLSS